MPKRWVILGILAATALTAALWALLFSDSEPFYQGRSLRHYVTGFYRPSGGDEDGEWEADDAVKHIGTNAIPFLLAWIHDEEPPWEDKFYELSHHLPEPIRPRRRSPLRYCVPKAFASLSSTARFAVPELIKLAADTNDLTTAELAAACLGGIPLEDPSPLMILLTNDHEPIRSSAQAVLTMQGETAAAAIPLMPAQYNTARQGFRPRPLRGLADRPEIAIPAITNVLLDRTYEGRWATAFALGRYGSNARSATPALVTALRDPDRWVRWAVTNALRAIAPEALTNAPAK